MKLNLIAVLFILFIQTTNSNNKNEEISGTQKAYYECTEPKSIDSSLFSVRPGELYFEFQTKTIPKDLKSKGFYWIDEDYSKYFVAYFINTSNKSFKAVRQDESLIMIQEAYDDQGRWRPIEHWVPSSCGNSYFHPLILEPGNYVMVPIRKYSGSFETKIRLKMKKGSVIFYSKSFEGTIDKKQFKKETENVDGILYDGPPDYLNIK